MSPFLLTCFETEEERLNYHIYGEKEFHPRIAFIVGLYGMVCDNTKFYGEQQLGYFFSAVNQSTNHWIENFDPTDDHFISLWAKEDWILLLEFERDFIKIYKNLTYEQHEAIKLLHNEDYLELKTKIYLLLDSLVNSSNPSTSK